MHSYENHKLIVNQALNDMYPDDNFSFAEEALSSFDFNLNEPNYGSGLVDQHQWDWELENIINGDVAVIPTCSGVASMEYDSSSSPAEMDSYNIHNDWQNMLSVDMVDIANTPILEPVEDLINIIPNMLAENEIKPPATISKPPATPPVHNKSVSSGKKMDTSARCYINDKNERLPSELDISVQFSDSEGESDSDEIDTENNNSSHDMQSSKNQPEFNKENNMINQPIEIKNDCKINQKDNKLEENVENEFVDVINLSNDDLVLQACDVDSLLEKFEATIEQNTEQPKPNGFSEVQADNFKISKMSPEISISNHLQQTPQIKNYKMSNSYVQNRSEQISGTNNYKMSQEISNDYTRNCPRPTPHIKDNSRWSQSHVPTQHKVTKNFQSHGHKKSDTRQSTGSKKSSEILNSLPPELVKKIQNNNKRKLVQVIDPVPNKRRAISKKQSEVTVTPQQPQQEINSVKLDHSYCLKQDCKKEEGYPKVVFPPSNPSLTNLKCPNKDSGFQSANEDSMESQPQPEYINERTVLKSNIMKRQLNSANVNAKQGVSVLKPKVNENNTTFNLYTSTIPELCGLNKFSGMPTTQSANSVKECSKSKRKLNLAEYKKRRTLPRSAGGNTQNQSPVSSGPCSPASPKDGQESYQQRLMQMAAEVLKATPKSAVQTTSTAAQQEGPAPTAAPVQSVAVAPSMPLHLEKKEFVSIGVNTDGAGLSLKHLNVPLRELEEIRPILENASDKISNHSLIASVIENVQIKKIHKLVKNDLKNRLPEQHHGEDKVIMWPEKNRPKKPTKDAYVQTETCEIVEPETSSYRRMRNSRSPSIENKRQKRKKRSTSRDSDYSYSSQSSCKSYCSSGSYSPTPMPRYRRSCNDGNNEHLRAVYERRIIYVGGIDSTMTAEGLRRRFQRFGKIVDVKLHFPHHRDNYGFVTFANREDAYRAVEHGNDDSSYPRYDLNFGGRRIFCDKEYADLDNVHEDMYHPSPVQDTSVQDMSFDILLEETAAIMTRKRKCT